MAWAAVRLAERWVGLAAVIVLSIVGSLCAQPEAGADESSAEVLLGDHLVMLARGRLVAEGDPREDQLVRARVLLDFALGLNPADAEGWLLRSELAQLLGDAEADRKALGRYCRLRPEDDAAQVRLISQALESRQTLEARAAGAWRFVGGKNADRFSPSLRSRLSLLVVEAALERGNDADASGQVRRAAGLDSTNRQAAELVYRLAVSRGADPETVGEGLVGVVRSDPLNPQARQALAEWLLSAGVYDLAAEQLEVGWSVGMRGLEPGYIFKWAWCLAAGGKGEDALNLLENFEIRVAAQQTQQAKSGGAAGPVGVPVDLELLRLVVARHVGNKVAADRAAERLRSTYKQRIDAGDAQVLAEWVWFALLFDLGDVQEEAVDRVVAEIGAEHPAGVRVKGWGLIRKGRAEEAAAVLKQTAGGDPFAAYGVAKSFGPNDEKNRVAYLRQVIAVGPGTTAGLLAVFDLGQAHKSSQAGRAVRRVMRSWPSDLAAPNPQPNRWVRIKIKSEKASFGYLDPIVANVELYNATGMDLSLGSGGTLPARLFIYASPRKGGVALPELPPVVVDLGRRLRLEAQDGFNIDVRLDRSDLGALLASNPFDTLTIGVAGVLDPRPNNVTGRPDPAPLGATGSITAIRRQGSILNQDSIKVWIGDLSAGGRGEQMRSIARLIKAMPLLAAGGGEIAELREEAANAVNAYYLDADSVTRAWMVYLIDPIGPVVGMLKPIMDSATRSDVPLVRVAYLASQVKDVESRDLNAALRHEGPLIVEFASAVRDGLLADQDSKATGGPESK